MKRALLFCLSLALSSLSAQTFQIGHHAENPGYLDVSRNRTVWTEVYYPANTAGDDVPLANGNFPVIVFGHGFVIPWSGYSWVWEYFVPRGYICILPRTEGNTSPNHANFGGDLAFLAQHFTATENANPASLFYQKVSPKNAIMGHSMGGGASFLACQNNSNITTMVTFAPANTNPSAITAAANVNLPSLVIAGSKDCVTPTSQHQLPMYNAFPASVCKAYVEIKDGSHCHFTSGQGSADLCYSAEGLSCPFTTYTSLANQHSRTLQAAEPWLRFYLQGDCSGWTDFQANLTSMNSSQQATNQQSCSQTLPTATINALGNTTFCEGGSVVLESVGNTSCVWSNGATGCTQTITTAGTYSVTVSNGICSATSSPVNVNVNPLPPAPVISQNGGDLTCNCTANIYQWTVNGQPFAGNSPTITPLAGSTGTASLTITDANGCSATSEPFSFTVSIKESAFLSSLMIAPNPAGNSLRLQLETLSHQSALEAQIQDITGKVIKCFKLSAYGSQLEADLDVSDLGAGIYNLSIIGSDNRADVRFVKE